jgi:hypothetical protein
MEFDFQGLFDRMIGIRGMINGMDNRRLHHNIGLLHLVERR